jgi:hypothetical protein
MNLKAVFVTAVAIGITQYAVAQISTPDELIGQQNAITTAVPFLSISPDSRSAALGDAGVASSPDANSAYWNAGKLAFIDKSKGASINYTPWLGKIVNDMKVFYLSGFLKLNQEQAIAAGIKYFDLGEISFRDVSGTSLGDFNPREFSVDFTYSRMLTENFSIGGTGKFIYSNLTGSFSGNGTADARPGSGVAADIGVYYTKTFEKRANGNNLALGATITNIGSKISYTDGNNRDFIPTTLRLGAAYTVNLDLFNSITFLTDFSKLMVPTPHGSNTDASLLSGMFGSFTDAPGGAKEEFREIMTSVGVEYWYNQAFAARLGYFNEAKMKGNRKYMTVGVGFRKDVFGFDVAYLVPTNKREHPLAETIRFSLLFQIGQTILDREDSVTD